MGLYRNKLTYLMTNLGLGLLSGICFGLAYSLVKTLIGSPYFYFNQPWPALLGNLLLFCIFCGLAGFIFSIMISLVSILRKKLLSPKSLVLFVAVCLVSFSGGYIIDWWLSNLFFGYRHFLPHSLVDFLLFLYAVILMPLVYLFLKILFRTKASVKLLIISFLILSVFTGEWIALGFIEGGFAFRRNESRFVKGKDLNVIVILIDALMPPKVGCYGNTKGLTENIDKLADRGVAFLNTISQSNWTHASIPSLFTSTYPIVHGVTNEYKKLPESMTTIAEILQDNGYLTSAFMTNPWIARQFGLGQGFDFYLDLIERDPSRWYDLYYKLGSQLGILRTPPACFPTAEILTEEAISWIERFKDKSFFLYLHYMDVHGPYVRHNLSDTGFVYREEASLTQHEKIPISMYESQVFYVDYHIGLLIEKLRQLGLEKETLIIITADHGHYLDEQDNPQSRETMYEYAIRIPLVLSLPGMFDSGLKINRQAQEIDIAPTIISLLELESDVPMQGVALQDVIAAQQKGLEERAVFSEVGPSLLAGDNHLIAVRKPPWKYIYDILNRKKELYRLDLDPQEQNNLIDKMPRIAELYHKEILNYLLEGVALSETIGCWSIGGSEETVEIDQTTEQALKSLGYLQ